MRAVEELREGKGRQLSAGCDEERRGHHEGIYEYNNTARARGWPLEIMWHVEPERERGWSAPWTLVTVHLRRVQPAVMKQCSTSATPYIGTIRPPEGAACCGLQWSVARPGAYVPVGFSVSVLMYGCRGAVALCLSLRDRYRHR